jgi:archaemetzincin
LWWIGRGPEDEALLAPISAHLASSFGRPVTRLAAVAAPREAYDPRRDQWASSKVLTWLAERRPADASKVLGVTDADLFIPILTFVFGEAQLGGPAAVVSTARLGQPGFARSREILSARLRKECVHELGHTFGLMHCERPCAMARSPGLPEVDAKKDAICPECRIRLEELARESEARDE